MSEGRRIPSGGQFIIMLGTAFVSSILKHSCFGFFLPFSWRHAKIVRFTILWKRKQWWRHIGAKREPLRLLAVYISLTIGTRICAGEIFSFRTYFKIYWNLFNVCIAQFRFPLSVSYFVKLDSIVCNFRRTYANYSKGIKVSSSRG